MRDVGKGGGARKEGQGRGMRSKRIDRMEGGGRAEGMSGYVGEMKSEREGGRGKEESEGRGGGREEGLGVREEGLGVRD